MEVFEGRSSVFQGKQRRDAVSQTILSQHWIHWEQAKLRRLFYDVKGLDLNSTTNSLS